MANFKVGQRVRINCPGCSAHRREATVWEISLNEEIEDLDGVTRIAPIVISVDIDGLGRDDGWECEWAYEPHELTPLTDPFAEKFIASIKALGPLEQEAYEMPGPSIEFINYLLSRDLRNLP